MNFLQLFLQIIFSLIVIAFGILCGRWLCMIAPEEAAKAKIWAKLLLKIFTAIIFIAIIAGVLLGFENTLFIVEFMLFLCAMMFGILYFKEK